MSRKPEKLPSSPAFRRVAGGVLQIVWILLLLALASYTYRDIAWEYDPPNSPVHNWVGAIGAYAACAVFSLFGLVGFLVPLALALLGIVLWISENRALRTAVWLGVMLLAGAVLVDLRPTLLQNTVVNKLNLGDFSGGWVGWLLGRCALQRLLGPIGAGLLATAFLVAGVFFVSRTRPVELFRGWSDLWHSWRDRSAALADHRDGEDARLRRERAKAERERLRIQREAMKIRAQQEREERKRRQQAERDARRERLAAEREARQQRIAAERERIAAVRESERARAEEERRKAEELRLALQREKAREREEREAERARIAEEERIAEEQRKAEQERIAEEQRLAEEQRHAEAVEQARIAREAAEKERQRLLEERAAAAALPPPSWRLPPMTLLQPIPEGAATAATDGDDVTAHQDTIDTIEGTLARFGVEAHVTHVEQGPTVTLFELLPAPDVKVERIAALHRNLTLALKADSVRIQAPIPGKGVVGIEVPRRQPSPVVLRQLLESPQWLTSKASLPLAMGLDVGGQILMADLAKLPHLLIAGATGMGKTVCMNSLLAGLLMTRTPDELKLILVDPKIVEFSGYNGLPHLITPVITEAKKVTAGLKWAISEMEKRFRLFQKARVRDIQGYNKRPIVTQPTLFDPSPDELSPEPPPPPEAPAEGAAPSLADFVVPEADSPLPDTSENPENLESAEQIGTSVPNPPADPADSPDSDPDSDSSSDLSPDSDEDRLPDRLPYIVIIIDELADLMLTASADIEPAIQRLTQLARATGIHLVIATQRPTVKVITGTIKANIPGRIAFKVAAAIDSRVVLDRDGADKLMPRGDMLVLPGNDRLVRAQGAWTKDEEIQAIAEYWKNQGKPAFDPGLQQKMTAKSTGGIGAGGDSDEDDEADEELVERALDVIRATHRASTSAIQRRLRIGYTRAARLMDILEERHYIGPARGAGPREILFDLLPPPSDSSPS